MIQNVQNVHITSHVYKLFRNHWTSQENVAGDELDSYSLISALVWIKVRSYWRWYPILYFLLTNTIVPALLSQLMIIGTLSNYKTCTGFFYNCSPQTDEQVRISDFLWFFMVPGWFPWFKVGFHGSRWVSIVSHGSGLVFVGYRLFFSWFLMVSGWFFMVPGWLLWFFMVSGRFLWFHVSFYGFWQFQIGFSGFQVGLYSFWGSRLVFHGSSLVVMVFHGFRLAFVVPGWFFMIPGWFLWFFRVPGLLFMVSGWFYQSELSAGSAKWDAENTPKGNCLIWIMARNIALY